VAGRIRSIEKCNDLIGTKTHNLLAYNIVPQPTTLPHSPSILIASLNKKLNKINLAPYLNLHRIQNPKCTHRISGFQQNPLQKLTAYCTLMSRMTKLYCFNN
jgi:hypothetical protein